MKPQSAKDHKRPLNKYRKAKTPFDYLIQRIEVNKDNPDSCWLFTGSLDRDGYGQVHCSSSAKKLGVTRAHQMSYATFVGDIPSGMWVLHKCDNPTCCNPDHLFLGTAQDNSDDMWGKGRWKSGASKKYDWDYIVGQHGLKDCMELSEELGCSYSLVCMVWRKHGKTGKNWHFGRKQKAKS